MNSKIEELISSLQKEYLFIHNEKVDINKLFNDIQIIYDELYKKNYVLNSQQLINLENVDSMLTQDNVMKFFLLESKVNFIRLNSVFIQYEYHLIELFKLLASDTQLLTNMLLFCDEKSLNVLRLSKVIYNSILGSAITNVDSNKVISILTNLISRQFSTTNDPQKLIISGKCAFIRLFKFYVDNLTTAKTFLVATLQEPIEYILMNDDLYLDISSKITKERMFSTKNSKYPDKVLECRQNVVDRIAEAVNLFIKKLTDSFIFLPESYVYIVNSLFKALNENKNLKRIDVLKSCIDFIFDCFIYPAMLNPELYGIIGDFPLSSISKHNLIEIGKIIKSLIYEEINKTNNLVSFESRPYQSLPADLLEKFEDYSLHSLINELSIWSETTLSNIEIDFPNPIDNTMDLNRSLSLISETDLYFLLKITKHLSSESEIEYAELDIILNRISLVDPDNYISKCVISRGTESLISNLQENDEALKSRLISKYDELDITSNVPDLIILILVIDPFIECPGMQSEDKIINEMKCHTESMNNSIKHKKVLSNNYDINSTSMSSFGIRDSRRDSSSSRSCFSSGETSIHTTSSSRKPKISTSKLDETVMRMDDARKHIDNIQHVSADGSRKRTHFNDREFVGSDMVEGIFEVASTHSVQSEDVDSRFDIEDNNEQNRVITINNSEVDVLHKGRNYTSVVDSTFIHQSSVTSENVQVRNGDASQSMPESLIPNSSVTDLDDLRAGVGAGIDDASSDLVYWQNISGRDTPSMSGGRDSPSSSVGGSDLPNNVKPDVTEKFCKFDIPKTVEARSTVSDTWSTDVLASDSETTEQMENRRLVEIQEENHPSSYSQRASESEDNSENQYSSVKSTKEAVDKLYVQSASSTSKDNNIPSIQLETTISGSSLRFKSNTSIRTRPTRNYGSLMTFHNKDDDKTLMQGNTSTASPISESPSTVRKGLVEKIRDKFSNTKVKKDSKCFKIVNKVDQDEDGRCNSKFNEGSLIDLESIEEMLVRYGSKPIAKPLDFATILNTTSEETPIPAFFDPKTPPETWPAWKVSKKNLRIILEKLYIKTGHEKLLFSRQSNNSKHPLIRLLKMCLAEANHLQEDYMITQLEETLRVIQLFDNEYISKMISSMLKELKKRKIYITYLVNTHTQLRLIKKRAEELLLRCTRSCQMTSRSMISFCVHEILRVQNIHFENFFKKISSKGYDEYNSCSSPIKLEFDHSKCSNDTTSSRSQSVADMLDWASRILNNQSYLSTMTIERQQETRMYLERIVMSQLHRFSITLNDDMAEFDRDIVFHRELESLQKIVSASQLSINKKFHGLIPFEAAQKELLKINCYKTPRDKVLCIQKATHKIAILLKMTKHDCIPGADDILPVLIYVIIMANPPRLLSNMSYIDALCASQLEGQNQYMWCQFTAAVNEVRRLLTSPSRQ